MKHLFSTLLLAVFLPLLASAQSQQMKQKYPSFLQVDDYPNGVKYLPAPPDTSSVQFLYDFSRYQWGKDMRSTPRGRLAAEDANQSDENLLHNFEEAFGMPLGKEQTPEIFRLVSFMNTDAGLSTRKAKNYYMRKRPYVQFHEPTSVPEDETSHYLSGSYPSGHSATGWAVALVLAEINVDRQDAILKRGYEIGESRVIAGYHYQSDVDNGRLAGAACVARLHADKNFQKQLEKAKKEFVKLRALSN